MHDESAVIQVDDVVSSLGGASIKVDGYDVSPIEFRSLHEGRRESELRVNFVQGPLCAVVWEKGLA
jgi:hypothetical protein